MRWLLLVVVIAMGLAGPGVAAEGTSTSSVGLEEFKLADGRTLIGRYSESEQKLYIRSENPGKVRMAITVAAADIVERKPWVERKAIVDPAEVARRPPAPASPFRIEARDVQAVQARRRRDEELRAEAVSRAEYWHQRGVEFDPDTTTARDMDIQGPQLQLKADQQRQAEARAAAEAAQAERRRQLEQAQARDRERFLEEARVRQRAQAVAQAAAQAEMEAKQAEWLRESQARMEADRQRYLSERKDKDTADLLRRVVALIAMVVMFAFPTVIALVRRHRHRVPIVVLSAMTPAILVLGSFGLMHPVFLMMIPWDAAMLLGGTFGLMAWMVAVVWSFMPNLGPVPASPAVQPAAPPVGTAADRKPTVALPSLAASAMPAVANPVSTIPATSPPVDAQRPFPPRPRSTPRASRPATEAWVKGSVGFLSSAVVGIGGGLLIVHLINSGRYIYSDLTAVPLGNDPVRIEASDYPAVMATTCTVTDVWCIRDNGEVICGVRDHQGKRGVLYSRANVPVGALVHAKRLGTAYITREKPIRYLPEEQFQGRPIPDEVEPAVVYLHIPDAQLERLRGHLPGFSGHIVPTANMMTLSRVTPPRLGPLPALSVDEVVTAAGGDPLMLCQVVSGHQP